MRLRKNDPSGNYWYLCDGVSPASPVLSDGYVSFTPGISEITGAGSRFYLPDVQGNSRGLLDSNQVNTDGYNWDGFGNLISRGGSNPTAFAWNVSSGYQTDNDSGLKLLGHRYYDTRIGRFISQDPAGDGDNWYAYAGNDPMDGVDPLGLVASVIDTGSTWIYGHSSYPDLGGWGNDESIWSSGGGLAAMHNALYSNLNVITYHDYTPTEVHKIKHLINIINTTPVGHALVKKAIRSSKDYKIIKNRGMPHGSWRTGETYFNLDWHAWINTVDGGRDASSLRILAHEFGHSIGGYSDSYDPANSDPNNFMMNVDRVENPIMTFMDGPGAARTTYP